MYVVREGHLYDQGERVDDGLTMLGMEAPPFGYAVEVGAADGFAQSVTADLEYEGWTVLCIEPNPNYWPALCRNRKLPMPYAVSSTNRELVKFTSLRTHNPHTDEDDFTAGSGLEFSMERLKLHSPGDFSKSTEEVFRVPQRTLDWCLAAAGFPRVDVVSIDTEGHDLEVLKGFDILRWKPQFVGVENWDDDPAYVRWFAERGYERQRRVAVNDYYTPIKADRAAVPLSIDMKKQ